MGLFFNRKKEQKQEPKEEVEQTQEPTTGEKFYISNTEKTRALTNEELFGISLSLIIAEQNGAYVDSLDVGKTDFPQKQMMQRNWNIYHSGDALEFLERRIEEGHRELFNRLLDIYIEQDCVDAVQIDFSGTEFETRDYDEEDDDEDEAEGDEYEYLDWQYVVGHLENLDAVYELDDANAWIGDMADDLKIGTDAWDFGRMVFVARVCYSLGYLTEEQAWMYINRIVELAKKKFDNWESYATSYLIGRAMWSGNDGEWETVAGFAADALDAKDSPWPKLNW